MVSLTNGVLLEGNSQKRALENGYRSLFSGGALPKYKPRKVSAVRDFPPGCGWNVPRISRQSDENVVASDKNERVDAFAANCVGTVGIRVDCQSGEVEGTRAGEDMDVSLDNLIGEAVSAVRMVNGVNNEGFSTEVEAVGVELSKDLADVALEVPKESHWKEDQVLLKESPEAEGSGLVNYMHEEEKKNLLEIGAVGDRMAPKGSAKSWSPPQWPIGDSGAVEETILRLNNKYQRRRVSASRDFPPFCGTNAPRPTEEDRLRVSGTKSLCGVEKALERSEENGPVMDCGTQGGTLRDALEDMIVREMMKGNVVESGGGIRDPNFEMIQLKEVVPEPRKSLTAIEMESEDITSSVGAVKEMTDVESGGGIQDDDSEKIESEEIVGEPLKPLKMITMENEDAISLVETVGKEIVVHLHDTTLKRKPLHYVAGLGDIEGRVIVQGLMAAPFCPWRQGRGRISVSVGDKSGSKTKRLDLTGRKRLKLVTKTDNYKADYSTGKAEKETPVFAGKAAHGSSGAIIVRDVESQLVLNVEQHADFPARETPSDFGVSLPPFGPNTSSHGDARNRVRETLRLFQAICRKLLQGEEAKLRQGEESKSKKQGKDGSKRIDLLAAKIIKEKGKEVNTGRNIVGAVPGVEVGDEFQFRVELAIVGIHRLYQAGIDYSKHDGKVIAISIVASGAYADDMENADVLIYSGQGGNVTGKDKQPEDQKLERGNLALKNSISVKNPVRVIRGSKEKASDSLYTRGKVATSYVYDGLYTVGNYWTDTGPHGKLVFMFELRRIPGQPELAWKEVKESKKYKIREGVRVDDISGGKESFPICAVNTIDDEKPAPFTYTTKMIYPEWYLTALPTACDCTGRCSYSRKCLCAVKNGGEIPYNYNGAIVEAKPLVYECGPSCKCPPSCYNRVSQHGIKIQLEIFKTETRGWGVRSLSSIPSGTFICEYTGELLEDKEAEQRVGNDEYLFDIGQNYSDCSHKPDMQSDSSEVIEEGGFTIDAAQYGNVGRFINHSCSPNLYAQNVLYDHEDKRMPHIMFFAAENIPPLQELTYHYNYSMDEVYDLNGNIKMKSCYCGSAECTGRMY